LISCIIVSCSASSAVDQSFGAVFAFISGCLGPDKVRFDLSSRNKRL